jgi:hypothetical protein
MMAGGGSVFHSATAGLVGTEEALSATVAGAHTSRRPAWKRFADTGVRDTPRPAPLRKRVRRADLSRVTDYPAPILDFSFLGSVQVVRGRQVCGARMVGCPVTGTAAPAQA